uniref:Had superfamily n=1 Tax=Colletotrichum fructicola (strain Nara gc5) TaxID=1213859 RepID=L2FS87_COLFN
MVTAPTRRTPTASTSPSPPPPTSPTSSSSPTTSPSSSPSSPPTAASSATTSASPPAAASPTLLALKTINDSLPAGEKPIAPEECLVFEDSVPGVEAGRRAGMRVVWCPHKMLLNEYKGREKDVLAGRTGEAGQVDMHQVGEVDDGWAEYMDTLENFPYDKFGITIPPVEVDDEPFMKENVGEVLVEKANGSA